jgi:hypothetical protein
LYGVIGPECLVSRFYVANIYIAFSKAYAFN